MTDRQLPSGERRVIAGGSGLIGQAVAHSWQEAGHDVVILSRDRKTAQRREAGRRVTWDGHSLGEWSAAIDGAAVVLNLCGESIGEGRWTDRRKADLINSRVVPTNLLARAIDGCVNKPAHVLQASAVGFYGAGPTEADETTQAGDDYPADLASVWEAAAEGFNVPLTICRFGVVLDRTSGALPRLLLPFKFWFGGPLGSGEQWLSWIHIADLVAALNFVLERKINGPVNVVAPNAITNTEFAVNAASALGRPNWLRTPALLLQLLLGEQASIVLEGQRVVPRRLLAEGFEFEFPTVDVALRDLVRSDVY